MQRNVRKITMQIEQNKDGIFTIALCPLHGKKYLTRITTRQVHSKGQQYRKEAERLFTVRSGERPENLFFVWEV